MGLCIDAFELDHPEHLVDRVAHRAVLRLRGRATRAWKRGELRRRGREEGGAPAPVAPRRSESCRLGLQDDDPQGRVGHQQVVGRPETGEPGSDDGDVRIAVAR